jgi:type II secretory pathway pseudopilin PulG
MEGRRGLTIIEVLAVIAVLLAISALLMPGLSGWVESSRADSAVAQIEAGVAAGRAKARESGRPVELRIVAEGGALVEREDRADGAPTLASIVIPLASGARVQSAEDPKEHEDKTPPSGSVGQREGRPPAQVSAEPVVLAVCLPDGTVEAGAPSELVVGARTLGLTIGRWTGSVSASARKAESKERDAEQPTSAPMARAGTGAPS